MGFKRQKELDKEKRMHILGIMEGKIKYERITDI